MTTVGIKICKRTHVSFLSVPSMNFTFQKNYAAQTLCSHSIIQSSPTPYSSTTYKSTLYLVSLGNLAAFLLGDLAHQNNYSTLHRPSNTPAKDSSLLEIPNRVAIFPICCFLCHNSYYFVSLDVDKRISQCPKKLTTTRFITFPTFMRSSVTLIAFSETSHCFANVEILMRVFCYRESILLCPYCAPVMPLSCPNWSFADLFWSEC